MLTQNDTIDKLSTQKKTILFFIIVLKTMKTKEKYIPMPTMVCFVGSKFFLISKMFIIYVILESK